MRILKYKLSDQRGVVFVMVIIALGTLLAFAALALDVGNVMVVKNELQNIADGAALAGARTLGRLYECDGDIVACPRPMPYLNQLTYMADGTTIKKAVTDVALMNYAGGKTGITINDADIVIGNWNTTTTPKKVDPITLASPDAVQVTARRDASANSPISTFFARIMGINTMNVSATAAAALTGWSTAEPGGLPLPVAINKSWVADPIHCDNNLTFHPSSAGTCASWHAYLDNDAYDPNSNDMRSLIDAIAALNFSSPKTIAGQTQYDFTNGTLASLFTHNNIQNLFNVMRVKNDGILDMDTSDDTWTISVPVFDDTLAGCSPNGLLTIVGFATIKITGVDPPPTTTIYAKLKCDNVVKGRGSGSYYGTKGSIPGLVQ